MVNPTTSFSSTFPGIRLLMAHLLPEPARFAVDNKQVRYQSNRWVSNDQLKSAADVIAALDSASVPAGSNIKSTWREVDLMVLRSETGAPGLSYSEPVPPLAQAKARMRQLIGSLRPGKFYPDVQVPVDLQAYRQAMLEITNLGRRDPDYRRNNKYASDLGAEQATTDIGQEKIYHHQSIPPYFEDLSLDGPLSEAAQLQAEWIAHVGKLSHDGPPDYQGTNLVDLSARLEYFAKDYVTAGEAGGGIGSPEDWMMSETHYRPWFNIGNDVRFVGFGAALGKDDVLYAFGIGGVSRPSTSQSEPKTKTSSGSSAKAPAQGVGAQTVTTLPFPAGTEMVPGTRYTSADGKFYISIQADRNLVVRRTADDGFVWALVDQGVDYTKTTGARMTAAGKFEVYDASGGTLWSIPDQGTPGNVFDLTPIGTPHVRVEGSPGSFTLPLLGGQPLVQGEKYTFGDHYIIFQNDNNIVIRRISDDGFTWGLNEQPGVDYRKATSARMTDHDHFVVYDTGGNVLWQMGPNTKPTGSMWGEQHGLLISTDGKPSIIK